MTSSSDSNTEPEEGSVEEEEEFTSDTNVRVKYLGSVLSFVIIAWFLLLVTLSAANVISLSSVTGMISTVLVMLVLAAGTWVFGIDLFDKWSG